jgi:DNA-binding protein H-NS
MKIETLDALQDEDLRAIRSRADELLELHDRERKDKAREDARAILAAAGLSLGDLVSKATNARSKTASYHSGHRYQHPGNKQLVWTAKGQKPRWLRELEAEGKRPVEVQPEQVH